jgi:MOSC domain-containing protein YiiM
VAARSPRSAVRPLCDRTRRAGRRRARRPARPRRRRKGGASVSREHHEALARAFPEARHLVPGGLGENLSTAGITEDIACIGDVFALGTARLQIAQPRTPCWKIDARCGVEGVAAHVAEHGIAGWYFRVLAPGECAAGDALIHLERPPAPSAWRASIAPAGVQRPALQALDLLASAPGLAPEWVRKIRDRMALAAELRR